ncbi:MAG: lysophospholipid acyltransferase family protein [Bdellovibrionota bacterium]
MNGCLEALRTAWRLSVIGGATAGVSALALAAFASGKEPDWGYDHLRRLWTGSVLRGCGIRFEAGGLENLEGVPPCVFVSNHGSEWDWYLFIHFIERHWRAVIRADLRNFPLGGHMAARVEQIFIEPRAGSEVLIEKCRSVLARGLSVLVYPEGKRPLPGEVRDFRPGAFDLACALKVPIVPVAVVEENPAIERGPWGRTFGHDPGRVRLVVREALYPAADTPLERERLRKESREAVCRVVFGTDWEV